MKTWGNESSFENPVRFVSVPVQYLHLTRNSNPSLVNLVTHRDLFFKASCACYCGQCSFLSLPPCHSRWPGHEFDKDTCVLTHPSLPPRALKHTQLLLPAYFIRFDTPHPPAIVRTGEGRTGLFVGI